jgi:hypothetical protein
MWSRYDSFLSITTGISVPFMSSQIAGKLVSTLSIRLNFVQQFRLTVCLTKVQNFAIRLSPSTKIHNPKSTLAKSHQMHMLHANIDLVFHFQHRLA